MDERRTGEAETSLADDALETARGCLADLFVRLLPVLIVGGIGLALIATGTETTTDALGQETTDIDATGWYGAALVCAAVAMFFGRGTIQGLRQAFSGQATFGQRMAGPANLKFLVVTLIAVAAGLLSLAFATGLVAAP